ncbi:MAG: serine hydrolase [Gemmatimonadota bacterium]|nr:MAG: serine hydrolase [Gemmatimonadota bacterium]
MTSRRRLLGRGTVVALAVALLFIAGREVYVRHVPPIGGKVEWETASPESLGVERDRLQALSADLATRGTEAFLVVKNDKLIHEWYAPLHGSWRLEGTASLAKSLIAGMALMVALSDGLVELDDPAWRYIPMWADDSLKRQVTLRHLATHSSGMLHGREGRSSGWSKSFWSRDADLYDQVLSAVPFAFEPGRDFLYSGPAFAALDYALTAALKDGPQRDIESLLRERIMEPLGIPGSAWMISYGKSFEADGMTIYASWSGARYTARAVARLGQLMLHQGRWGDRQLVDSVWVGRTTTYSGTPLPDPGANPKHPAPAAGWWSNALGTWPYLPGDAFAGAGSGGQVLLVVPSLDLVAVRFGDALGDETVETDLWKSLDLHLLAPLARALEVRSTPPHTGP